MAFHRAVGVEFFHLYDNDSTDDVQAFLAPLVEAGVCRIQTWSRTRNEHCAKQPQIYAYRDAFERLRGQTEWLAVIDLDEFIVPLRHDTIVSELRATFSDVDAVLCNWRVFGSSGLREGDGQPVIERFRQASSIDFEANRNVKSILKASANPIGFIHNHVCQPGSLVVNSAREVMGRDVQVIEPVWSAFQVNHYYCKSWQEFLVKRMKGDAGSNTNTPKSLGSFAIHDMNDVEDLAALRFASKMHEELSGFRSIMGARRYGA